MSWSPCLALPAADTQQLPAQGLSSGPAVWPLLALAWNCKEPGTRPLHLSLGFPEPECAHLDRELLTPARGLSRLRGGELRMWLCGTSASPQAHGPVQFPVPKRTVLGDQSHSLCKYMFALCEPGD